MKKFIFPALILLIVATLYTSCKKSGATPVTKTTPTAVVSTLAGSGAIGSTNGAGASASFNVPSGVAVDAAGNVYVADPFNNMIRKVSPAGIISTFAGSGAQGSANGIGNSASFVFPFGVAVDAAGNVYVADNGTSLIRKISPGGVVSTLAGSGSQGAANGIGVAASFVFPTGVAVDAAGNVYVADTFNNMIRKISAGGVVSTLAGSGVKGSADGTGVAATFNLPYDVAVDAAGNVYVTDSGNNLIRKISPTGVVSTLAGSGVSGFANGTGVAASFGLLWGIAVDLAGNVYIADAGNNMIRKINLAGLVSTFAGNLAGGAANGPVGSASFNGPRGVAVDAAGNVYVADTGNNMIRKITVE